MKRLTIVLTDEEYGDLERRALEDRRTVRQMAERLVTMPQQQQAVGADWTWRPQTVPYTTPYWNPFGSATICDGSMTTVTNGLRVV